MTSKYYLPWLVALALAVGCSDDSTDKPTPDAGADAKVTTDDAKVTNEASTPDKGSTPDTTKSTKLTVAAVQYGGGNYTYASGCSDDICGLGYYIKEAAQKGASLIVTPEYAQSQKTAELSPKVGDAPAQSANWKDGGIIKTYAKLADTLNVTLVFNLITQEGTGSSAKLYNTSVAVGPDGKVVGRHYKYQLFSNESSQLTPGPDLKTSYFTTAAGKAALMICADAQCLVNGLTINSDCTSHSATMLKALFSGKPKLLLFSAFWTVGGTSMWASLNVQKKLAMQGVWVIAANTTKGQGYGGGIWKPGGDALKTVQNAKPTVVMGDIPIK